MYERKKNKQHYVWRYYLESWSCNEQVYCLRDGKIFKANIKDLAQKRDFYKSQPLGEYEIRLVKAYINKFPAHLRSVQMKALELFLAPHNGKKILDEIIELRNGDINDELLEIGEKIDVMINNVEEELHSTIESQSLRFVDFIRAEDVCFWSVPQDKLSFLGFVSLQMLRTKKIQDRLAIAIKKNMPEDCSLNKIWGVLRHLYSMNIAHSLFCDPEYRLILLLNDTKVGFITSDQPVLNTFAIGKDQSAMPVDFEIYYPLSPRKAILISAKKYIEKDGCIHLSESEVRLYNSFQFEMSHEQVYSCSKNALETYGGIVI